MKGILPGLDMDTDFDKDNLVSFGKQTKNVFHLWLIDDIGDARCSVAATCNSRFLVILMGRNCVWGAFHRHGSPTMSGVVHTTATGACYMCH